MLLAHNIGKTTTLFLSTTIFLYGTVDNDYGIGSIRPYIYTQGERDPPERKSDFLLSPERNFK